MPRLNAPLQALGLTLFTAAVQLAGGVAFGLIAMLAIGVASLV